MRRARLAWVTLLLAGCGGAGGADGVEGIVARDSAGVTIVEHSAAAVEAVPLATLGEPTFAIGGEDASPEFDGTFYSRGWLQDDAVLALHNREYTFRRFDPSGTVLGSYGRRGEGPDEFRAMMPLRLGGDSLLLVEMTRSSAKVLRGDLTTGAERSFGEGPRFEIQIFGSGPDGTLLAILYQMGQQTERSGPPSREPRYLIRSRPGSGAWDTVVVAEGELAYPTVFSEGGQEFPSRRFVTFGPSPLQTVWGDRLVVVNNGDWTIREHDLDGALVRSTRFALPLRAATQEMKDSVNARENRQLDQMQVPEAMRNQLVAMALSTVFADSVAPYDRVLVARDGDLWIRQNEVPVDTSTTWMQLGRDGRLARRLVLPRDWALLDVDGDRALVRRTDDLDLGYLEVRPIAAGDQ